MDKAGQMMNYLGKHGELTGSRRWGNAMPDSDYDYFMDENKAMHIYKRLEKIPEINEHLFDAKFYTVEGAPAPHTLRNTHNITFFVDGVKFNILGYHPDDLPKTMRLNEIMDDIMNNTDIGEQACDDKQIRIALFQAALNIAFDVDVEPEVDEIDDFPF